MSDRKAAKIDDVTKEGEVVAIVATLNVWDKDGDLTEQGFFGTQPTKIVSSHDWSDILLGKGTVTDDDGKLAVFVGSLNLEDPAAQVLHSKLRYDLASPPPLIEWSYGFKVLPGGSRPDTEDQNRRILQPIVARGKSTPGGRIYEVSPVLVGAGEGTGTRSVKSGQTRSILAELADLGDADAARLLAEFEDLDAVQTGTKFVDQAERVAKALVGLADRAEEIAAARRTHRLGADALARIESVQKELREVEARLVRVAMVDPDPMTVALLREFSRFNSLVGG